MTSLQIVALVAILYALLLFGVAFFADRAARKSKSYFFTSPLVYTLSLSVYCTAWTFYGAVGSAARNGFEFLTIYLGPTIIFVGWWWFLRRLVRIGRLEKLTSIADFVSARYGKSSSLAAVITIIAIIGTTPYIALQLQSLTLSFSVFTTEPLAADTQTTETLIAFITAIGLAIFTTIFGTRNITVSERHEGVVTAIALEAIVKMLALVAVGIAVVYWISTSTTPLMTADISARFEAHSFYSSRWATLIFLSAFALICLPRMFQVMVVENHNERQLALASWAFPTYLFIMCLFVMPIALFGLSNLGTDANPDLFVITVPLSQGQDALAIIAFLGGFSSATSMVIMATLALATMVSNHLILPLSLMLQSKAPHLQSDLRRITVVSRRVTIFVLLGLGYLYYSLSGGSDALASIGLIAFLGVSQFIPALVGGLFWRQATKAGALSGVLTGFVVWLFTLFLPSFENSFVMPASVIEQGLFGISLLKPYSLFGSDIADPLVHAFIWSLGANSVIFILVSLATRPSDMELLQAAIFQSDAALRRPRSAFHTSGSAHELLGLSQRILGRVAGQAFFKRAAETQGKVNALPEITAELLDELEREFASVVGAATAQAIIRQIGGHDDLSVSDLIAVADESARVRAYSAELLTKSQELENTAQQLRTANMQLISMGAQRDDFLSQVSHELRTPMTSIRSFSEILKNTTKSDADKSTYFASIINDESQRLTRLLDEILELNFLESRVPRLNYVMTDSAELLKRALIAADSLIEERQAKISLPDQSFALETDADRLVQALINLISNGIKHNDKPNPTIWVSASLVDSEDEGATMVQICVTDDGPGIRPEDHDMVFEKFATLSGDNSKKGVGLGLPISARIIQLLGGSLTLAESENGASFTILLPRHKQDTTMTDTSEARPS